MEPGITITVRVPSEVFEHKHPSLLQKTVAYLDRLVDAGLLCKFDETKYAASFYITFKPTKKDQGKIAGYPLKYIADRPDFLFEVQCSTLPNQNILLLRESQTNGKYQLYATNQNAFSRIKNIFGINVVPEITLVEQHTPSEEYSYNLELTPRQNIVAQRLVQLRRQSKAA